MTVDDANTALAIASNKESRLNAYRLLAQAAAQAADALDWELKNEDESEGHALQSRLIDASNTLTMAAEYLTDMRSGSLRAIDELNQAQVHIALAIEAL